MNGKKQRREIEVKKEIKVQIDEHVEMAQAKKFSTGNTGYGFYGKVEIDGERYQVSLNVVKLKPKGVKL